MRQLLFLLLIVPMVSAADYNLSHGQTIMYNYTNTTVNTTGNLTNITRENVSVSFMCEAANSCNQPNPVIINMIPGSSEDLNDGVCRFQATCSSCTENPPEDTCVVDKTLNPGTDFKLIEGACDIEISVPENPECEELDAKLESVFRDVKIEKQNNQSISIQIEGEEALNVPISTRDFTWNGEIEISCPEQQIVEGGLDNSTFDELLETCASVAPLLANDWIRPTLNACTETARNHQADLRNCDDEKGVLRDQIAEERADKVAVQSRLEACESGWSECRAIVGDQEGSKDNWVIVSIAFIILFLVSFGINIMLGREMLREAS